MIVVQRSQDRSFGTGSPTSTRNETETSTPLGYNPPAWATQSGRAEFDRCWPWLLASLKEFFQTHTKEQVWERIEDCRAFFWPGRECAIIGQLVKHPIGIKAFNYWLQGGKLDELKTMWPGVEAWARAQVPLEVQPRLPITGNGRDGWARVMEGNWQKGPTTRIKWL